MALQPTIYLFVLIFAIVPSSDAVGYRGFNSTSGTSRGCSTITRLAAPGCPCNLPRQPCVSWSNSYCINGRCACRGSDTVNPINGKCLGPFSFVVIEEWCKESATPTYRVYDTVLFTNAAFPVSCTSVLTTATASAPGNNYVFNADQFRLPTGAQTVVTGIIVNCVDSRQQSASYTVPVLSSAAITALANC